MHCPEQYIKDNGMQRRDARDISNIYIEKMVWKSNEIVLDLGCGPGDVTSDILYPFLKNKINQLVSLSWSKYYFLQLLCIYIIFFFRLVLINQ